MNALSDAMLRIARPCCAMSGIAVLRDARLREPHQGLSFLSARSSSLCVDIPRWNSLARALFSLHGTAALRFATQRGARLCPAIQGDATHRYATPGHAAQGTPHHGHFIFVTASPCFAGPGQARQRYAALGNASLGFALQRVATPGCAGLGSASRRTASHSNVTSFSSLRRQVWLRDAWLCHARRGAARSCEAALGDAWLCRALQGVARHRTAGLCVAHQTNVFSSRILVPRSIHRTRSRRITCRVSR